MDDLGDREGEDAKGEECGKDDPVKLAEKNELWFALNNQTTVSKSYQDHPEQEVEVHGVEVDHDDRPSSELQGVTPEHPVLLHQGHHQEGEATDRRQNP